MDPTVWFLTSNAGKLAEATHHFSTLGMTVRALEVPEGSIVEPQASTLEEVAEAKIRQAMDHLPHEGTMVLVEDAGLFVDALDGFPGVYSS
ncbi:MAG: non-canonical purine NTP pyrophosphatase, partial [Candidatus Poseidoniales archaeon]